VTFPSETVLFAKLKSFRCWPNAKFAMRAEPHKLKARVVRLPVPAGTDDRARMRRAEPRGKEGKNRWLDPW
jgi:hypothetical protein